MSIINNYNLTEILFFILSISIIICIILFIFLIGKYNIGNDNKDIISFFSDKLFKFIVFPLFLIVVAIFITLANIIN